MSSSRQKKPIVRRATKAGSWYESDKDESDRQLSQWLSSAGPSQFGPAKAIISPHAGHFHCGSCAAYAYKEISPEVSRIFILGPSHYVRLSDIALSPATEYETPFYNLKIDQDVYKELLAFKDDFQVMSLKTDEEEHSIELQLPFIAKIMENRTEPFTIVPMMVGSMRPEAERRYGQILSKYLADPKTAFVISSDFCHWGHRFDYQYYKKQWGAIYQSIEHLDKLGMKAIKDLKLDSFTSYSSKYGNTICGRHPIAILVAALEHLNTQSLSDPTKPRYAMKFLNYKQSSKVSEMNDSSVSYAAASVKGMDSSYNFQNQNDIVDV